MTLFMDGHCNFAVYEFDGLELTALYNVILSFQALCIHSQYQYLAEKNNARIRNTKLFRKKLNSSQRPTSITIGKYNLTN